MRYVIIHKSVYLLLCVVNLVFFDVFSSGFPIYHGFIALVVLVNLICILRGSAGLKVYSVEVTHSWLRISMVGIIIILLGVFLALPKMDDIMGIVFIATLSLSPLVHVIWFPLVDILAPIKLSTVLLFLGVCICLVLVEREFLKQLKRNQHLFLRPAEENG